MSTRRFIVLTLAAVVIAIVMIFNHARSVQYGYELSLLQEKNARLRVSIAQLEGSVTMLASPSRLRAENDRLQLGLVGPSRWREPATAVATAKLTGSVDRGHARR